MEIPCGCGRSCPTGGRDVVLLILAVEDDGRLWTGLVHVV